VSDVLRDGDTVTAIVSVEKSSPPSMKVPQAARSTPSSGAADVGEKDAPKKKNDEKDTPAKKSDEKDTPTKKKTTKKDKNEGAVDDAKAKPSAGKSSGGPSVAEPSHPALVGDSGDAPLGTNLKVGVRNAAVDARGQQQQQQQQEQQQQPDPYAMYEELLTQPGRPSDEMIAKSLVRAYELMNAGFTDKVCGCALCSWRWLCNLLHHCVRGPRRSYLHRRCSSPWSC
jgi:hypothetical protein